MTNQSPDQRAIVYLEHLNMGATYADVGRQFGTSADAVRNVIRRYNQRTTGSYRGYHATPETPQPMREELVAIPEVGEYATTDEALSLETPERDLEIWTVDIERLPRVEFSWSAKKYAGYTPEKFMLQDSRMVSFAAKQLHGPTIFASEFHHGTENMLNTLWHVLDRATIVIGYNHRRFDIPHIDGEFKDAGLPTYRPFKMIDLFTAIKQRFNYDYNTMSSIAKRWDLSEEKMENEGFDLWRRCFFDDPDAWEIMKAYNIQDVKTNEAIYLDNLQWLTGSIPNLGLWAGDPDSLVCPACGCDKVEEDGTASTGVTLFVAYRCTNCGYRSRSNTKVASAVLRPITR